MLWYCGTHQTTRTWKHKRDWKASTNFSLKRDFRNSSPCMLLPNTLHDVFGSKQRFFSDSRRQDQRRSYINFDEDWIVHGFWCFKDLRNFYLSFLVLQGFTDVKLLSTNEGLLETHHFNFGILHLYSKFVYNLHLRQKAFKS